MELVVVMENMWTSLTSGSVTPSVIMVVPILVSSSKDTLAPAATLLISGFVRVPIIRKVVLYQNLVNI